jgi:alpha-glucuronidase
MTSLTMKVLVCTLLALGCHGLTVWPKPRQQTDSNVLYTLDAPSFTFNGVGPGAQSSVLLDAFKRFRGILFLHTPSTTEKERIFKKSKANVDITGVDVHVASNDESLSLETDASYNLTITSPTISIHANTVYGALYGLESVSQLVDRGTFINGTTITDSPRYQFRSTMIDTARITIP